MNMCNCRTPDNEQKYGLQAPRWCQSYGLKTKTQTLASAHSAVDKDGTEGLHLNTRNVVKRTHKDEALSYLTEGCNTFASPQTLHVTVDGVHAAWVENDVCLLWRQNARKQKLPSKKKLSE